MHGTQTNESETLIHRIPDRRECYCGECTAHRAENVHLKTKNFSNANGLDITVGSENRPSKAKTFVMKTEVLWITWMIYVEESIKIGPTLLLLSEHDLFFSGSTIILRRHSWR